MDHKRFITLTGGGCWNLNKVSAWSILHRAARGLFGLHPSKQVTLGSESKRKTTNMLHGGNITPSPKAEQVKVSFDKRHNNERQLGYRDVFGFNDDKSEKPRGGDYSDIVDTDKAVQYYFTPCYIRLI